MSFTNQSKSYTNYSSIVTYSVGDVVIYLNRMYRCILSSLNNLPTNVTYWTSYISNSSKNNASGVTNSTKHNA